MHTHVHTEINHGHKYNPCRSQNNILYRHLMYVIALVPNENHMLLPFFLNGFMFAFPSPRMEMQNSNQ